MYDRMQWFGSAVTILSGRATYYQTIGLDNREILNNLRYLRKRINRRSWKHRGKIIWIYKVNHQKTISTVNDEVPSTLPSTYT